LFLFLVINRNSFNLIFF